MIGWSNILRKFISLDWGSTYNDTAIHSDPLDTSIHKVNTHLAAVILFSLQDSWWPRRAATTSYMRMVLCQSTGWIVSLYHHSLIALSPTFSPIIQSYFSISSVARILHSLWHKQRRLRLATLVSFHSTPHGPRQQVISQYCPFATTWTFPPAPLELHTTVHSITLPRAILHQVPISLFITAPAPEATAHHDWSINLLDTEH